jgi:two-component system nitrate/nitrite response regulator NarL
MKIIVADDHALFREGMRHLLMRLDDNVSVLEANCHDVALRLMIENPDADLALVDLHMPGKDDLSGLAELLNRSQTIPIVVLSGSEELETIHRVIKAGAMGYLPKHENAEVLLCALRLVLNGGIYVPPLYVTSTSAVFQAQNRLTPRQTEVLRNMCSGLSNKEIGKVMNLSESTVKCHVSAIFRELNVDNRLQAASAARKIGLQFENNQNS